MRGFGGGAESFCLKSWSDLIPSWQKEEEKWEQWETLFSWAPESLQMGTAAMKLKYTCSLEEKLWKPRQCIKKQRHHFADKGASGQSCGFSQESCTMWELDHEVWAPRSWRFWIVQRRLLRVPWTAGRSNQSILKEINPEYSLKGLMLKVKLHFGHPMQRAHSLEKTLTLEKIEGQGKRGRQRMSWSDGIADSVDMNLSKLWETVKDRGARRAAIHAAANSQTQLSDWTTRQSLSKNVLF